MATVLHKVYIELKRMFNTQFKGEAAITHYNAFMENLIEAVTPSSDLLTIESLDVHQTSSTGTTPTFTDSNYVVKYETDIANSQGEEAVQTRIYHLNGETTTGGGIAFEFVIPTNSAVLAVAYVTARRTGGSAGTAGDCAAYELKGLFKDVAGTVSAVGTSTSTIIGESQVGWSCDLSAIFPPNVSILCTGATNNTIIWHVELKLMKVTI